ncbi:hypothetical protein [uncultured Aquimarina sp.]|uniref:hypothetical protein n=1 Tax=uncultured Aquimarina sp. TaxID=575652 RepID=UPI00261EED56|nr:hypothetical protein [uncultured Aquimarina sp.]
MKQEQQLLYKVMRNFEGMQKIEVFDLLHRMEVLLYYAKSPLQSDHLKRIISSDMDRESAVDPFGFTILPNGNFCEFIGSNGVLHIYKEVNRFLPDWPIFNSYHYKSKYLPLELKKLTRRNLLKSFEGKPYQEKIKDFLKMNKVTKKDLITNKMLLLNL